MIVNTRAVALQGVGFGALAVASLGFLLEQPARAEGPFFVKVDAKTAAIYSVSGNLSATILVADSASAVQASAPVPVISVSDGRIEAFSEPARVVIRNATPSAVIATAE